MNFSCRTFPSGNAWPCDLDVSVDPVVGVTVALAFAIAALGFCGLIYLLSKGRT